MDKSIIVEGKTSTEAIEKGLKELKVSRDRVEIKVLENEDKRSFFNILTPRVVKVELTLKEEADVEKKFNKVDMQEKKPINKTKRTSLTSEELEIVKCNLNNFLEQFVSKLNNIKYEIFSDEEYVYVTLTGETAGTLIGYRGETLNSLQVILTSIANKEVENKAHIILDIEGYREKGG